MVEAEAEAGSHARAHAVEAEAGSHARARYRSSRSASHSCGPRFREERECAAGPLEETAPLAEQPPEGREGTEQPPEGREGPSSRGRRGALAGRISARRSRRGGARSRQRWRLCSRSRREALVRTEGGWGPGYGDNRNRVWGRDLGVHSKLMALVRAVLELCFGLGIYI